MTTTTPTPKTLRERAVAALATADEHREYTAVAQASSAYALNLLRIAAMLDAAPTEPRAPAEVSPPDDHEPARGDVYEYAGAHYVIHEGSTPGTVRMSPLVRPLSGIGTLVMPDSQPAADFVRRFCRRVSPPRSAP